MGARVIPVCLAMGLLAAACSSGDATPSVVPLSGPMPALSGQTLDGGSFDRGDYAGKIVVVNFWNQDCPPCRAEQPVLEADSSRFSSQALVVVGVVYVGGNWPNDPTAAVAFLRQNGVTYPNLLDPSSALARAFAIPGIPTTVIADRAGRLRFRILGRVRPGQLELLVSEIDSGRSDPG